MGDVAADVRKVSMTRIVDETRRAFARLKILERLEQEPTNLDDIRVTHPEVLFGSIHDGSHTLRYTGVLV